MLETKYGRDCKHGGHYPCSLIKVVNAEQLLHFQSDHTQVIDLFILEYVCLHHMD